MDIIETIPADKNYHYFENFVKEIYPKESQRFRLGNDPKQDHLKACYVLTDKAKVKARCAFYHNPKLTYKGKKAVTIGSYECVDEYTYSNELFSFIKMKAKECKADFIIGPMDGSTWSNYRFSLHNDKPNFFMEPYHHIIYNEQFKKAGFKVIEEYFSNFSDALYYDDKKINIRENLLLEQGYRVRNMDEDDYENELYRLGAFSIESFKRNLFYTPIKPSQFVESFLQYKEFIKPEFVFLVEDSIKEIHAFFYGFPDYFNPESKTVIVKSFARKIDTPVKKDLTNLLVQKFHKKAKQLGFENAIHAFFHENNASRRVSERYSGKNYKQYALYGLEL